MIQQTLLRALFLVFRVLIQALALGTACVGSLSIAQEIGPAGNSRVAKSPIPPPEEFVRLDQNADGMLAEVEFVAGRSKDQLSRWKRDFRVMDLNHDASLSVSEFSLSLPLTADSNGRGEVPDPIADWMHARNQELMKVFRSHDTDGNGTLLVTEWTREQWNTILPEFDGILPTTWDRDQDGSVDLEECRFMLELAYGFRQSEGMPLRTATGFVVNWPYLRGLDKNRDGSWSKDEIVAKYWGGPEKGAVVFEKMDTDKDGQASPQEVWESQVFYRDIFKQFLEFDKNFDGNVDQKELLAGVTPLQQPLASCVMKAFDADSNGTLSFLEFRSTPIANPVSDWHVRRTDKNADGELSGSEFYLENSPFLISLSAEFFRRLDLDRNHTITSSELPYATNAAQPVPQFTFQSLDRNRDAKLTFDEIFAEAPDVSNPTVAATRRREKGYLESAWKRADPDENGHLTVEEYDRAAIAFRPAVMKLVLSLDTDGDALVSCPEYIAPVAAENQSRATRDFLVADADRDDLLTGVELSRIPGRLTAGDQAAIPDPILDWMEARLATILNEFQKSDADHDGKLSLDQWPATKWSMIVPVLHGMRTETWDQNHDGQITEVECRALLEITDGIRRLDGLPFRLPTGHVINWPFLRNLDSNGDQTWTQDEFIPKFWSGPEKGASVFKEIDTDKNGQLTLQEVWNSPVFFRDIVRLFYDFDTNLDGAVDQRELVRGVTAAQQPLSWQLMRCFDIDRDQKLSLYEFRASPIANIMADWHLPRFDVDFDGKLSEAEFYCEPLPLMLGLNHEYFQRYDGNEDGFITRSELLYFIDYKQVPARVSFEFKDVNQDGLLTMKERMHEMKPPSSQPADPQQQALDLIQTTKQFAAADTDQNGTLDLDEYERSIATTAAKPLVVAKSEQPADNLPGMRREPDHSPAPNVGEQSPVSMKPVTAEVRANATQPPAPVAAAPLNSNPEPDQSQVWWPQILLGTALIAVICSGTWWGLRQKP